MFLENLVFDAADPRRLGRFWSEALGAQPLTDAEDVFETRLTVDGGPVLDLCFQRVGEPATARPRLHLDLLGGARQASTVERMLTLGATHLDIGQADVPWVVLADVEGNAFCVMEERESYRDTGPIAAVPIDSADPERDAAFWAALSQWTRGAGERGASIRHPSGRGPVLEFCPEREPKGAAKNRLHLDLRLETRDDPEVMVGRVAELGGRELHPGWGELPWRVFADPSGNDFCILPGRP
jgi:hypothetical protein